MTLSLILIVVYFTVVNLAVFLTARAAHRSSTEFLIAGRNLGVWACAMVVAAEWLGGLSTIGVSERAFTTGTLEPVLYNLATSLGMLIIGFTVARHYRSRGVHTVGEMLGFLFGERIGKVASLAFLLAYVILAFVQIQTCAGVVAPLFGISWLWAVLLSAGIITFYTYTGGMHALALTGIIHMFARYLGIGIALWIGLRKAGGLEPLRQSLIAGGAPDHLFNPFSHSLSSALSLVVGGILGGMAAQASIQPIFAAKDVKTAQRAAILSAFLIAPFGFLTALLGLLARSGLFIDTASISNPKMALTTLLLSPQFISPIWGGLALAGILAAIFSTAGPVNFAIVTIATKDIFQGMLRRQVSDAQLLQTARRLVLLVNLIIVPLALTIHSGILEAAYVSYAIRSVGAIVLLAGIYYRSWISETAVILAFASTILTGLYFMAAQWLAWPRADGTWLTLSLALLTLGVGNFIERPGKPKP
ncbi:MAG: sodium:solute symporter family protein [Bacteroidales bacterium]